MSVWCLMKEELDLADGIIHSFNSIDPLLSLSLLNCLKPFNELKKQTLHRYKPTHALAQSAQLSSGRERMGK